MAEKGLTFREFAERENDASPFEIFRRGIGVIQDIVTNARTKLLTGTIFDAFASLSDELLNKVRERDADETIKVSEIIAAEIEKVLPTIQKDRFISMLDMITTGLTEDGEIKAELKKHELDLGNKDDLKYVLQVFKEAIEFYEDEEYVTENPNEKLPDPLREIKKPKDIYRIFKTASGNLEKQMTRKNVKQACALLRIAAVIDYINIEPQFTILPEAEVALKKLLDKHFEADKTNRKIKFKSKRRGDVSPIIHRIIARKKKPKSILAKLLRNPEENAGSIMDGLGVTLLTGSKKDSLLLIYRLFFHPGTSIFPATSIQVGEGKNLLITKETIENALATEGGAENLVDEISISMEIRDEEKETMIDCKNPASGKAYKDLIHIVVKVILRLENGKRLRIPVEFQIKDVVRNAKIEKEAPHATYKEKQKKLIRKRLFGNNLITAFTEYRKRQKRKNTVTH